jgi:hypothetical protein
MTKREEQLHYRRLKQFARGVDWKRVNKTFTERFEKWWKEVEPWIRKQLEQADFVKASRFDLQRWVRGARKGFRSNLRSLLEGEMYGWIFYEASLPFDLGLAEKDFDVQYYLSSAKRLLNGEHLNISLDKVFYVPSHAAALVVAIEKRTHLLEKCKYECERRHLPKYQTVPPHIKFEIAKAIGMNPVSLSEFKSGRSKVYHRISKMLSELHYHQKGVARDT